MKIVITIDGPSGVGKTTIGQEIASKLNYSFFSSGKLYRYIAKYLMEYSDISYKELNLIIDEDGICKINNKEYEDKEIYNKEINEYSSEVAKEASVRQLIKESLLNYYKKLKRGLVIEGRDMGSVVFSDTDYKIYLDADENIRGQRREQQSDSQETIEEIKQRDHKDMFRDESPLVIPENAVLIDNTNKTKDETVKEIIRKLKLQ